MKKIPFTGDYDINDMITFCSGRAHKVMIFNQKNSHITEEKDIIDLITAYIDMNDPGFHRQFDVKSHNIIRHDAQVNFTSYTKHH